ncbi:TPA: asparagine synthase (glutamine-hydrolyzing) [Candidatus Sumerlaeota bacterium]|nr:asparagine synthase (glutamine-hydrolyzing) [Candidatus Sumerlaeota bacterium]
MCGITGYVNLAPPQPAQREILQRMANAIRHRGPNAEGIWTGGPTGFAHRRLSVIDLSTSSNQPMCNEDESVWIVFNGEIYNYQELREELLRAGHVFRSHGDTETLIHLYEQEGVGMLRKLRGMFAFAIWDTRTQTLFAARDRIGKKPFKYYIDENHFVFGSEVKAIAQHPAVRLEVSDHDVHQYLGFGYMLSPNTGFERIKKLPAAHYLLLRDGHLEISRYWRLDYRKQTTLSEAESEERILELLDESTRLRLMSDVPLGAFLSGGVDSSAVVAAMTRHSTTPVRTFSIGFDFEAYNELPHAREVAALFKTDHTEHVVKADAASVLPELVRLYEEPYGDSSALPSYYLAQVTRQSVTVALNGDGGDENFAGYQRYDIFMRLLNGIRTAQKFHLGWALSAAPALPGSFFHTIRRRAAAIAPLLNAPLAQVYGRVVCRTSDELSRELYTPEFYAAMRGWPHARFMSLGFGAPEAGAEPLHQALLWDVENYLAEDLCPKMDVATMAHALEARSPFLDHHFLEFSASLPAAWKYSQGDKKRLLKKALLKVLPREILYRKKQGFGIPVHDWFRGDLRPLFEDTVLAPSSRIRAYLSSAALDKLFQSHLAKRTDEGYRLWTLLTLELWLRNAGK